MPTIEDRSYLIIVMGVAGTGKSTIATLLAKQLQMGFIEADSYHSEEAINQMRKGLPLTDDIRDSWIERLCHAVKQKASRGESTILAYSGLKRHHRQKFNELNCNTLFLHLHLEFDVLKARLANRESHFFPVSLLQSQFDDFEPLVGADNEHVIDADRPIEATVADCSNHILSLGVEHA